MIDVKSILESFEYLKLKYSLDTIRGLPVWLFFILVTTVALVKFIINDSRYYLPVIFIPVVLYWVYFLIKRSWILVRFSKKINIIFAYNTTDSIPDNSFEEEYNALIKIIKSKIRDLNLSNRIRVIKKPSDIKFKTDEAAEIKTRLALPGSVFVVRGSVYKRKGRIVFITKFSYEFGNPKNKQKEYIKKKFREILNEGSFAGVFGESLGKFNIQDDDGFSERSLLSILYILGCTSFTHRDYRTAILLFEKYIEVYNDLANEYKNKFVSTKKYIEEFLLFLYLQEAYKYRKDKNYIKMKEYSEKVLKFQPDNYFACCNLAFYAEVEEGNRGRAEYYNDIAKLSAPRDLHIHLFNEAYFLLSNDEFIEALDIYKNIPDNTDVDGLSLREFFYSNYEKTGNIAMLFADGYVAYRWVDNNEGIASLREFLDNKDLDENVSFLEKETKSILEKH